MIGSPDTRRTAVVLTAGGLLWATATLVGGVDGGDRFVLAQSVWLVAQLLLLVGTLWLWQLDLHDGRRLGVAGFVLQVLGRTAFVVAEALALARGAVQDDLLPVAALLTALGLLLAGIAISRAGRWDGPGRFVVLVAGVYPFVAMFPLAATSADGPPAAVLLAWGLLFAAMGGALVRRSPAASSAGAGHARSRARTSGPQPGAAAVGPVPPLCRHDSCDVVHRLRMVAREQVTLAEYGPGEEVGDGRAHGSDPAT
jgi:hypothetical protein